MCRRYDWTDAEGLKLFAEDAFWLRHATAMYAGGEAQRRDGMRNWRQGAWSDYSAAAIAIDNITNDEKSGQLLSRLAKRRCEILVKHYWPEIRTVARALLKKRTMTGSEVRQIVSASTLKRRASLLGW